MSRFAALKNRLIAFREDCTEHQLYDQLTTIESLQLLMEQHVFAVWDFMSLLKSLQRELTCVIVPWRPSTNVAASRLINEIVLAEESDIGYGGHPASHFEMYLSAMRQAGADTRPVTTLVTALNKPDWRNVLRTTSIPTATRHFVETTFDIIESRDLCQIAAAFTFGREDLLPDIFQQIVSNLNVCAGGALDEFEHYLHRHIELDSDKHAVMAQQLMEMLCGSDPKNWQSAEYAAKRSLRARKHMWDAISYDIDSISPQPCLIGIS